MSIVNQISSANCLFLYKAATAALFVIYLAAYPLHSMSCFDQVPKELKPIICSFFVTQSLTESIKNLRLASIINKEFNALLPNKSAIATACVKRYAERYGNNALWLAIKDAICASNFGLLSFLSCTNIAWLKNADRQTLIDYALGKNGSAMTPLLRYSTEITQKADGPFKWQWTPLHMAAAYSDFELIKHMIALKISLDDQDCEGKTALHRVCAHGDTKAIDHLLASNADANLLNDVNSFALLLACKHQELPLKTMQLLLEKTDKSLINKNDDYGEFPLYRAVKNHLSLKAIRELVAHGADVNMLDGHNQTMLDLASGVGNSNVAAYFMQQHVPASRIFHNGAKQTSTLIHAIEQSLSSIKNIQQTYTISRGNAHITKAQAIETIKVNETIKLLLPQNIASNTLNFITTNKHSALSTVAIIEPIGILETLTKSAAQLLLDAGADVDPADPLAIPPIFAAIKSGNRGVLQLLLNHKANVNFRNPTGKTALHKACKWGREECVKLLLDQPGIDIAHRDNKGKSALEIAQDKKLSAIVTLLKAHQDKISVRDSNG